MYISEVNSDVRIVPAEEMFIDGDPTEKVIEISFDNDLKIQMDEAAAEDLFNSLNLHFSNL